MTSLQTKIKQIPANAGYYINVGNCLSVVYENTGTDAAPTISNAAFLLTLSTAGLTAAGISSLVNTVSTPGQAVFRDMGKTLLSSTRVFRKVQLLRSTLSLVNGGTDGVAGSVPDANTPTGYLTAYIELPGTGDYNSGYGFTPVARLG
jgi:hypothetical protein